MQRLAKTVFEHTEGGNNVRFAPSWGPIPEDADEWCVELHRLISFVYGDGLQCGERAPKWNTDNDNEFLDDEEKRRGLWSLEEFLFLPYGNGTTAMAEYAVGKQETGAWLFGLTGEKYGEWDAFLLLYVKCVNAGGKHTRLQSMRLGQWVNVGVHPWGKRMTFVRVLRGSKPAGRAKPSPAHPNPAQPSPAQHSPAQHSTAQHSTVLLGATLTHDVSHTPGLI
jgi:hypothetical protein